MRSRSKPAGASPLFALACPLGALCLLAGCSWADLAHSTVPASAELTPESVRARAIPTSTLDNVGSPTQTAATEPAGAQSPSKDPPDITQVVASFAAADASQASSAASPAADAAPPADVFALRQAVDFGLQNNPRLPAALAAIERARGQEDVAFSPFLPQIDYLSHAAITSPALGPAAAGATGIILPSATATHEYAQAELQLQWTLYDFGRTCGKYRQSQAREQIAELQSARVQKTIAYDVSSAYLLSLQASAGRRIQEEAIRRADATLHDTRARRAAGVAERDDVLRAEVQLSAAREDFDVARESELASLARLNNAMGRNASLPLTLVGWNSEPVFALSLVQCLDVAAAQRTEIAIAREEVAAAHFGRQAAKAEFLPKVYAVGSVGAVGGANVVTGGQEGAGLHIDMPLYSGGRHHGELHQADADIHQAMAGARSILDEVTLEVTLAYLAATTARQRIELDRPAIVEADENLRLVRNRYRNGQATPTDIVDAEVALTRAQQRLVSATYEYLGALAGLDYALDNPPGTLLGPAETPMDQNPEKPAVPIGNPPVPKKP
jgi:outer membrane protein